MRSVSGDVEAHQSQDQERERLTTLGGLAALSLDALSSVAYGPEAILVVLVTAGAAALKYSLPVTGAIVLLLAALVISYRQVIEAFPNGGGAYAVSKQHLGRVPSLVAAASLIVDYILNAAVGVSAGAEALTAAFPSLYGARVWLCLAVLALITAVNLWGVAESARVFTVPTVAFIVSMAVIIVVGAFRAQPAVTLGHTLPPVTDTVGTLLILKAFASGCSALTGVEAIANSVPQFRQPRARHAQHTEMWLGVLLGVLLLGLGALIHRWNVVPQTGTTVLAQLTAGAVGHNTLFYIIQMITLVLLALAANTSFGGLPVLAGLLAHDNFLPHVFGLRADRRVFRYGVGVLAVAAALLLVASRGDTQALVPLFAVGVFVGFTLSQVGMVRHWYTERSAGWVTKAWINGIGAVLTFAATVIELGQEWNAWRPEVPLITLRSAHRSIAKPIVSYLRDVEAEDKYHRLVVLIPEVQPARPWQWVMHNQRGLILDRAIRHGTQDVVLCRLRYRLGTLAAEEADAEASRPASDAPPGVALPSLTLPRPIRGGPARPSDKHRKLPPDNVRHAAAPLVAR